MRSASLIEEDEDIMGLVEEVCVGGTLQDLEDILDTNEKSSRVIPVESVEMYGVIVGMELDMRCENNVMINTKYNTVGKKVKPEARPLPVDSEKTRIGVSEDPSLRKSVDNETHVYGGVRNELLCRRKGILDTGRGEVFLGNAKGPWEGFCIHTKRDWLHGLEDNGADGDLPD